MPEQFWRRLLKFGIISLIVYLMVGYITLFTTIVRNELKIWGGRDAVTALSYAGGGSTVQAQVRNVFGDPLPHAVVYMAGRVIQADNEGIFEIRNLKSGRYTMEIFAGGYQRYKREIQVEEGENSPVIKYETGLWPEGLLVDFHVYYNDAQEILGYTGFANGSEEPVYIERATLLDPRGEVITDFLHDHDGFAYYADFSSKIVVVEEPQKALKWPPKTWQPAEFPPISGWHPNGIYTLEVHYGNEEQHSLGRYMVLQITDYLDLESNWNPHVSGPTFSEPTY